MMATNLNAIHFSVTVSSRYGRDDADVSASFASQRPEKRLAELAVLTCAFNAWAAEQKAAFEQEQQGGV
jgi:hypothetical protein